MTDKEREKFEMVMQELQDLWEENRPEMSDLHNKARGMRSTQVGTLVLFLIRKGLL